MLECGKSSVYGQKRKMDALFNVSFRQISSLDAKLPQE